jgi:hypothetical protein
MEAYEELIRFFSRSELSWYSWVGGAEVEEGRRKEAEMGEGSGANEVDANSGVLRAVDADVMAVRIRAEGV